MATNFEFNAWCTEYEIEEETAKILKDKGFKSYRSISKITDEILKKEFKNVSPGQFVLLQDAIKLLQPPQTGNRTTTVSPPQQDTTETGNSTATINPPQQDNDITQPTITPQDLLNMWTNTVGDNRENTDTRGKCPHYDPFGLGTGPHAAKHRVIGDYITHMATSDPTNNDSNVTIGGVEFAIARGKRISPDKIKPPHYMESSLRILREMIIEDGLPTPQIINHVNYLIQIACLAQTHTWKRVLNYDTIYRREQSEHGFTWGSNSAFMLQSQLMTYDQTQPQQPRQIKKMNYITDPSTGKQVCEKWNGNGCSFPNCRFMHICKTCFSTSHNQMQHRPSQGKNQ